MEIKWRQTITALHSLDHYIFQFFSLVSQVLYESNSFVFERKQNLFFQFLSFVVLLMYFLKKYSFYKKYRTSPRRTFWKLYGEFVSFDLAFFNFCF